jgi:hypothetical protein
MEVTLEQRRPEMPAGDDALAWVPVPDKTIELSSHNVRGATVWDGRLPLPQTRGQVPYRLAIREYETLVTSRGLLGTTTDRRLVYADTIEI